MDISPELTFPKKRLDLKKWLPVLIWCAIIFVFSHQPKAALAQFQPSNIVQEPTLYFGLSADTLLSKGAHVVLFAVLGALLANATRVPWQTLLLGLSYAGFDEWHQLFVAGRTPRLMDIGFDLIGILLAMIIMAVLGFYHREKEPEIHFYWEMEDA